MTPSEIEIKMYAEKINDAPADTDGILVPAAILGDVLNATNICHFEVWISPDPLYFLVEPK